jgi:hypothetical protein
LQDWPDTDSEQVCAVERFVIDAGPGYGHGTQPQRQLMCPV